MWANINITGPSIIRATVGNIPIIRLRAPAIDPPASPSAISLVYETKSPTYPVIPYKAYKPWPNFPPTDFICLPCVKTIAIIPTIIPYLPIVANDPLPIANTPIDTKVSTHDPTSYRASKGLPSLIKT